MKFEFTRTTKADTKVWGESNRRLHHNLEELVSSRLEEKVVLEYVMALIQELRQAGGCEHGDMLFLMYDSPSSMPSDARVDFVYTPTYLAATILMTAMNRYNSIAVNSEIREAAYCVLNATTGRNFYGAGYEATEGFLDTLEIFAKGDTISFLKKFPDFNSHFARKIEEALTILEGSICSGKVKDAWSGDDYIRRGNAVLAMYRNSTAVDAEYIWYACYGSNVNRERFMLYINDCNDTTPPVADRPFVFKHNIYFAKSARLWDNGGKAFLDDTQPGHAYGRIYKITREQYEQVKHMEGSDYTKMLSLGTVAGIPVYSFTDTQKNTSVRIPSKDYFNTILSGLMDCYEGVADDADLATYLIGRVLPENTYSVVSTIKQSPHYMTNAEISRSIGLALADVATAVEWLVEHKVIQQDRRSVRAGHRPNSPEAFFFTTEGPCARELVAAMIEATI